MTPRKPPPKTPSQLADEHWDWIEGIIFTQMKLAMKLFKDGLVHGYKHRDKEIKDARVRPKPTKK